MAGISQLWLTQEELIWINSAMRGLEDRWDSHPEALPMIFWVAKRKITEALEPLACMAK